MCACEAAPFRDQTCCPGVVVEPHRFKAFNLSSLPFPVDVPPVRSMPQWQGVLVSVVVRLVTACRVASSRIHGSPAHVAGAHLCSPPTWPRAERRGQRWNGIAVRGSRIAPWTMMQFNVFDFLTMRVPVAVATLHPQVLCGCHTGLLAWHAARVQRRVYVRA